MGTRSLEEYKPLPIFFIGNIGYNLGKLQIELYTDKFSLWKTFKKYFICAQISVYPNEIFCYSSIIPTEQEYIPAVKFILFWFEYIMRLMIDSRTKNIIYCLVSKNHLVYNWDFWNIMKEERYCVFNSVHDSKFWIIYLQIFTRKLYICRSIKHYNNSKRFIWVNYSRMLNKYAINKWSILFSPSAKCPWQSKISKTANGGFFPETKILGNVVHDIVASSPRNNNPNTSASFVIVVKFIFVFWLWITYKRSLGMSFLLVGL